MSRRSSVSCIETFGENDGALVDAADQLVSAVAYYRGLLHEPTILDDSPLFQATEDRMSELLAHIAQTPASGALGLAVKTAVITELLLHDADASLLPDAMEVVHSVRSDIRRLMPAAMPSVRTSLL